MIDFIPPKNSKIDYVKVNYPETAKPRVDFETIKQLVEQFDCIPARITTFDYSNYHEDTKNSEWCLVWEFPVSHPEYFYHIFRIVIADYDPKSGEYKIVTVATETLTTDPNLYINQRIAEILKLDSRYNMVIRVSQT